MKGKNVLKPKKEKGPSAKKKDSHKKKNDKQAQDKTKIKRIPVEPIQNILPIKEIYQGMIITTDDRYIKIIEVLPINYSLRSDEEQDNIIRQFAGWLRVAPIRLQFKVITKKADSETIVRNVKIASAGETVQKCKDLTRNYIQFIRTISGEEALQRRFFIIFEYEPTTQRERTREEIAYEMNVLEAKIRGGISTCGNGTVEIIPRQRDFGVGEILYQILNKKSSEKETFSDRVIRMTADYMKVHGLDVKKDIVPEIPIANYIAPHGLDFTHKDFFVSDGLYQSIYMITRDGYPNAVYGGWMSLITEAGEGIDVDIILEKENKAVANEKVALKLKLNRVKASTRWDTDTDYEAIEGAVDSAKYIKTSLASGEDLYFIHTFITVSADNYELLQRRKEALHDFLFSHDIQTQEIHMRLEEAYKLTMPFLTKMKKSELMEFSARNVMTSGAASAYPFTSCVLCDENGIVLGINKQCSSLVNIDIFDTKKYKNANIAIVGTTGSGKTYTELTMALRMRILGIQTFIVAPDKAHEFQRACTAISGSFIRITPGSKNCINIMDIRPTLSPVTDLLDDVDSSEADSWLTQKTAQLITFFHILVPDLTNEEEQLIDESVVKTYGLFGITHDNNSVYVDGKKGGKLKKMPIIGDLYETLKERIETRRVANILGRFVTGSASSFNRQTNVDLTNRFIVFDLAELEGVMKSVGMFIVMDFLWSKIKENRTEKKAIFIDEGWQLIGASADCRAADFVYRIFKIIRGYGGAAIFATQDLSDLFAFQDGKYGKAIISNSKIKIVLGLEPQEAKSVQSALQLTQNEIRSVVNFDKGDALVCANSNKLPVYIRASELEHNLITTDRAELAKLYEQRRREREQENLANAFAPAKKDDDDFFDVFFGDEDETQEGNSADNSAAWTQPKENIKQNESQKSNIIKDDVGQFSERPLVDEQKVDDSVLGIWAMDQLADVAVENAKLSEEERLPGGSDELVSVDKDIDEYADESARNTDIRESTDRIYDNSGKNCITQLSEGVPDF